MSRDRPSGHEPHPCRTTIPSAKAANPTVCFTPSLDPRVAAERLSLILRSPIDPAPFAGRLRRLLHLSAAFTGSCPPPWPAPGLALTPELHRHSELWLPLAQITPAFRHFYRHALTREPIFSSTPFATAASWAGIVSLFPPDSGWPVNPALLLERLLDDGRLRLEFLCWSFMPRRFYGNGTDRYPGQMEFIRDWLGRQERGRTLRCLDTACGDGATSYALARLALEQGWPSERLCIEGWTLDPLEVWAAAHTRFPHDPSRGQPLRQALAALSPHGVGRSLRFRALDLETPPDHGERFDLIICNGLLGGPIVNHPLSMERITRNLAALLHPQGLLLVADRFHGGWRKSIPTEMLEKLLGSCGLRVAKAGEGMAGFREP